MRLTDNEVMRARYFYVRVVQGPPSSVEKTLSQLFLAHGREGHTLSDLSLSPPPQASWGGFFLGEPSLRDIN